MAHLLESRFQSAADSFSMMNEEDILDILFDKDDPLLKDIDCYMGEPMLESIDHTQNCSTQSYDQVNNSDFWSSFLKDVTKEDYECNIGVPSSDTPETDSTSHYSESSSPRSVSSGSENAETSIFIENTLINGSGNDSYINVYPESHDYCDSGHIQQVSESSMDLGADIVVVTSEAPAVEETTNHSVITIPESIPKPSVKSSAGRPKKRSVEEDLSFFNATPDLIHLTEDEKRLIKKEGLHIPTHLPLTRAEERELKRIRRKIRNKQSAQESRKRKKTYVDGLEDRVKICTTENLRLQKKVDILENQQKSLLEKIRQLQAMVSNSGGKNVSTSTCLMVILVSFVLLLIPSLFPNTTQTQFLTSTKSELPPTSGNSRTLLSAQELDSSNMDVKLSKENLNVSHEEYSVPKKPEFIEGMAIKNEIFLGFDDVGLQPHKRYPYYEVPSPGFYRDEAGSVTQNESSSVRFTDTGHNKKSLFQ